MELRRSTLFVFLFIVAKIGTTGFAQIDLIFSENITNYCVCSVSESVQCFYCGIKDLCELPFDEETVDKIECPFSCMKFEG